MKGKTQFCREIGEALAFLLAIKRSAGDLETEELLRRLDAWWAERA